MTFRVMLLLSFAFFSLSVSPWPTIFSTSRDVQAPINDDLWVAVQKKAKNAVVQIEVQTLAFNWREPYRAPEQSAGMGTGFFINAQGHILTNYHVVEDAARIDILIPHFGQERFEVEIIGVSPERDIALLRLTEESYKKIMAALGSINYLSFGDSDSLQRAQEIMVIGYPLGSRFTQITTGDLCGRQRVSLINQSCFQISAPINPGNSGGPVLDSHGKVIGLSFAGHIKAQNVGYIIPINEVKKAVQQLYIKQLLRTPILGAFFEQATETLTTYLKNPGKGGVYVLYVLPGSLLDKAGVQAGDMVYAVNGYLIDRYGDVSVPWTEDKMMPIDILNRAQDGDQIELVYYRNGEEKKASVALDSQKTLPIRQVYPDFEMSTIGYTAIGGLVVMELTYNHIAEFGASLNKYYKLENQTEPQLIISHVHPTSHAQRANIVSPGDIIDTVNGIKVRTLQEFNDAVLKTKETGFLNVVFQDRYTLVMAKDDILRDEGRLTNIFGYKKSPLIDQLAQ